MTAPDLVERYGAENVWPTPQQMVNRIIDATDEKRLVMAERIIHDGQRSDRLWWIEARLRESQVAREEMAEKVAASERRADALERGNDILADVVAKVRRALDDELVNLADDGARLSHSVIRRIEACLAVES